MKESCSVELPGLKKKKKNKESKAFCCLVNFWLGTLAILFHFNRCVFGDANTRRWMVCWYKALDKFAVFERFLLYSIVCLNYRHIIESTIMYFSLQSNLIVVTWHLLCLPAWDYEQKKLHLVHLGPSCIWLCIVKAWVGYCKALFVIYFECLYCPPRMSYVSCSGLFDWTINDFHFQLIKLCLRTHVTGVGVG